MSSSSSSSSLSPASRPAPAWRGRNSAKIVSGVGGGGVPAAQGPARGGNKAGSARRSPASGGGGTSHTSHASGMPQTGGKGSPRRGASSNGMLRSGGGGGFRDARPAPISAPATSPVAVYGGGVGGSSPVSPPAPHAGHPGVPGAHVPVPVPVPPHHGHHGRSRGNGRRRHGGSSPASPPAAPAGYYMPPPYSPVGMPVTPMGMSMGMVPHHPPYGGMMPYYPMYGGGVAPPPAAAVPMDRSVLLRAVAQQIEFYFSLENLVRDEYLRRQMDVEGYVPASIVLSFHRVARMCPDVATMLEALQTSPVVEVDTVNEKLRPRDGWAQWRFPNEDGTVGRPLYVKAASTDASAPKPRASTPPKVSPATMSPPGGSSSPPRVVAAAKGDGVDGKSGKPAAATGDDVSAQLQSLQLS